LRMTDLLNLDLHHETDSVSFHPLRRAYRVRNRACKVRPVDRGRTCCRSSTVESRGTSASLSHRLAEARQPCVRFQVMVAMFVNV